MDVLPFLAPTSSRSVGLDPFVLVGTEAVKQRLSWDPTTKIGKELMMKMFYMLCLIFIIFE